ncbi:MAG: hypothetical protein K9I02_04605 [Haliscomenobacter sp.]|nr:hypothetical protein [Haliscomenobacter sp.]
MMFSELEKVMSFSLESGQYLDAMADNVFGKKSSDGVKQTKGFLKRLYGFDSQYPPFAAFMYFWKMSEPNEKPLIAFLYAVNQDNLLAESVQVLQNVKLGTKVAVEHFEEIVEKYHPNQYAANTLRSTAQNLASSWKQAGFIEGKVKNIRIQPEITYRTACFAYLLAYLNGDRGDFIWNNIGVNALCLHESKLRALAIECAKNDLMQYQYAGSVTAINFTNLLIKMGIHGNSN